MSSAATEEANNGVSAPEGDPTCLHCKKPQSALTQALKRCAKCQTGHYCSRDCQKADWSNHKKSCSSRAGNDTASTSPTGSLSNPSQSEITAKAKQTMAVCDALSHDPKFDWQDLRRSPATLRNCFDFARNTWDTYWRKLLPGTVANEIRSGGDQEKMAFFAARDPSLASDAWPRFNRETYTDAVSRNFLIAKIILTPDRHGMYGGRYDFSEEVKNAARAIESP